MKCCHPAQARRLPGRLLLFLGLLAANSNGLLNAQDVYQGTFDSRVATIDTSQKCDEQPLIGATTTAPLTAGSTSSPPDAAKLTACAWGAITGATFTFEAPSAPLTGTFSNGASVINTSFRSTVTATANASLTGAGIGTALRLDSRGGQAYVNVQNGAPGGDCGQAGKGFQRDTKFFNQLPGTGTINTSATCTPGGLSVVQDSIRFEGNRVVEFKAFHENSGTFFMAIGDSVRPNAYSVSVQIFVRTTYLFRLGTATAPDSISLTNVSPPAGTVDPQKVQRFTASAPYVLNSANTGTITLVLSDQTNKTIASSSPVTVNKGSGTTAALTIDATTPASGTLTLKALLRSSSGDTTSAGVTYNIGAADSCSATGADVPSRSRAAAGDCSIIIDRFAPSNAEKIFAAAPLLPAFCATGLYSWTGPNDAELFLRLIDQSGAVIAITQGRIVRPGVLQPWGNCTDTKQPLFFLAEAPMPKFSIPANAPADLVLATYKLQAILRDALVGNRLKLSNTADYQVVPGVTFVVQRLVSPIQEEDPEESYDVELDPSLVTLHPPRNSGVHNSRHHRLPVF